MSSPIGYVFAREDRQKERTALLYFSCASSSDSPFVDLLAASKVTIHDRRQVGDAEGEVYKQLGVELRK